MGKSCGDPHSRGRASEGPPSLDPSPAFVPWKALKSFLSMAQETSVPSSGRKIIMPRVQNTKTIILSTADAFTTPAGIWTRWQPGKRTPVLLLACINKSYDSWVPCGN